MAIADAEPKKGEVDVTCTGSSSGTDMKPLPSLHGLVKYSALKDFSFSVPDVWDNINIRIFIECCHSNIEELKNRNDLEENKVWEKIAKSGLERGGSITCFNVNYCLELAKCLESFVSKNETKMVDNEIFKRLYEDVVDLLPYFAPVNSKRPRSRSKSVESSSVEKMDTPSLIQSEQLVYSPFQTHSEHSQAIRVIADILKKYHTGDFMTLSSRSTLWKEVSDCIDKKFGVQVNPKKFLESFKKGVARSVRLNSDPHARAKNFLEQVDAMLPFFDFITPLSIKKSEFLDLVDVSSEKIDTTACESSKQLNSTDSLVEKTAISQNTPKLRKHSTSAIDESCAMNIVSSSTTSVDDNCEKSSREEDQGNAVCGGSISPSKGTVASNDEEVKSSLTDDSEHPVSEEPVKKRGRKRKTAPTHLTPLRKMSLRHSSTLKKTEKALELSGKPGKLDNTLVQQLPIENSSSKGIVLASRNLISSGNKSQDRDVFFEGSSSSRSGDRRHDAPNCTPLVETPPVTAESGNDSEIEDVPLMGTNIRVRTRSGNFEPTKFQSNRSMNPIVLLEKVPHDQLRKTTSRRGRRPGQRIGRGMSRGRSSRNAEYGSTRPSSSPQPEISTTIETAVVRRRGRPRGLSNAQASTRSTMSFSSPESPQVNSTQMDVVRSLAMRSTSSQPTSSYMSSDLVRPQYPYPSSSNAIESFDFNSRVGSQSGAPEWFERFVSETRRHEVWKIHQIMKMQQDLLEAEVKNRKVLDQILATLNDRNDRT